MITDCHIHIQPMEMFKPHALELMKKKRPNFEQIVEFCHSPKKFLGYLDACGIDRAVLINYVAPEVIGFTNGVNQFIADACIRGTLRMFWPIWSRSFGWEFA
jgi:hypothetical protein